MSLKEKLLDLFFPPRCAFCRRTGVHGVFPKSHSGVR